MGITLRGSGAFLPPLASAIVRQAGRQAGWCVRAAVCRVRDTVAATGTMSAPVLLLSALFALAVCVSATSASSPQDSPDPHTDHDVMPTKKLQLQNGFFLEVPKDKNATTTGKLLSFGVDFNKSAEEGEL